ncbi:MAG: glucoamylase family protein [Ginsengibacter sp.]
MALLFITLFHFFGFQSTSTSDTGEYYFNRIFFDNSLMSGNYFYSDATYQSPSWIKNEEHRLPVNDKIFFSPGNSLELKYTSNDNGSWNASIKFYKWRGKDFIKMGNKLSFKLFVASNTLPDELPAIAIAKEDSVASAFIPLSSFIRNLSQKKWITVTIPLKDFKNISLHNSNDIDFIFFRQHSKEGKTHDLYLDQVEIIPGNISSENVTTAPQLIAAKGYEQHVDISWKKISETAPVKYVEIYRSADNKNYVPVAIQYPYTNRFSDFTGVTGKKFYYKISLVSENYSQSKFSNIVNATTHSLTDSAWLDMVQEACFRYYWEGAEPNSGLALEDIPARSHMIAAGASGFGMMAILAGVKRNFITREQAVQRFTKIVNFLLKAEKFHGAFPHFMDGRTGKVIPYFGKYDDGGDLVETSFLMEGLLTARQFFNADNQQEKYIWDSITKLWKGVEWDWYKRYPDSTFLYWHWSPDYAWHINHRFVGFNEAQITYLLAMASPTHPINPAMYYSGWASQSDYAQHYRSDWGGTNTGDKYFSDSIFYGIRLKVGVSNGGPLFFTQYSYLGFNPHLINDKYTNYFENNRDIALINYRYCLENPNHFPGYGAGCWGLTASDGPWGYKANEPVKSRDNGTIAPTGALSSFAYTPSESMAALKNYYHQYGKFLWGEYGFRDAFNLSQNWCSPIYMGLNQAPIVVMIENYRSGFIWNLFMKNPEIKAEVTSMFNQK